MPETLTLPLATARDTTRLGAALARVAGAGDTICLSGALGAGKSHLARAVIQSAQRAAGGRVEDVPSPTYTLVQTYRAGDLEILHADLYRLGDVSELDELGLGEAFGDALCLVEWPERLEEAVPGDALWIALATEGEGRVATLGGRGWEARMGKLAEMAHG